MICHQTPKECPKCGCIELFSNGTNHRKAVKNEMALNGREYEVIQFHENYKTWRCGSSKCKHRWEQITNRHTFTDPIITAYKLQKDIEEGVIIYTQ